MKAFLKRRWILLSCAVVLLVCSFFDLMVRRDSGTTAVYVYGIHGGDFHYARWKSLSTTRAGFRADSDLHTPKFGYLHAPYVTWSSGEDRIALPIWLPLIVIIGSLVIRELRWREKRARKAEQA